MRNIIGDWETGNGERGLGKWGWGRGMGIGDCEKMGNENVILSTSKNGGEWGMGIGEWISKWGMHKGKRPHHASNYF